MKKRILSVLLVLLTVSTVSISAFAIKPIADPWDEPENLEEDGGTYYTNNESGYVVVWETPECSLELGYVLVENGTELTVEYRVKYMDSIPWGHVTVTQGADESGETRSFDGWVLMTDFVYEDGTPVFIAPEDIPPHPMIVEPQPTPVPTPVPEETPEPTTPVPPDQAITIGNTYNNAIVYTSVAIAVVALLLVAYVLIKHKGLNKKGE